MFSILLKSPITFDLKENCAIEKKSQVTSVTISDVASSPLLFRYLQVMLLLCDCMDYNLSYGYHICLPWEKSSFFNTLVRAFAEIYINTWQGGAYILEHKTCDILAAERLRLMSFDNRLIIDSFQKAKCILIGRVFLNIQHCLRVNIVAICYPS